MSLVSLSRHIKIQICFFHRLLPPRSRKKKEEKNIAYHIDLRGMENILIDGLMCFIHIEYFTLHTDVVQQKQFQPSSPIAASKTFHTFFVVLFLSLRYMVLLRV